MKKNDARRTGRTTRIIDEAIQLFFEEGRVMILDHYHEGHEMKHEQNLLILRKFLERLKREHGILLKGNDINENTCTVYNPNFTQKCYS